MLEPCYANTYCSRGDRRAGILFKYRCQVVRHKEGKIAPAYTAGCCKIPGAYVAFAYLLYTLTFVLPCYRRERPWYARRAMCLSATLQQL